MTLREQAELKDSILDLLDDHTQLLCFSIGKILNESFDYCFVACTDLEKDGLVESKAQRYRNRDDKMIWITSKGRIFMSDRSQSYLSIFDSRQYTQTIKPQPRITNDVIKIGIMIMFGLSTAILGWLQYSENVELKETKIQYNRILHENDSLLNVIHIIKHDSIEPDSLL